MAVDRALDVLYEGEAALRQVDRELHALRPSAPALVEPPSHQPALIALPNVLQRASTEIHHLLTSLRDSRTALEQSTVERLQLTQAKLSEVSSTTELATAGILDGLDRAQQLVDRLDGDEGRDAATAADIRNTLRDELFTITGALQFQDITSQQLKHSSTLLLEMEGKLADVLQIIDPSMYGSRSADIAAALAGPQAFDSRATIANPEGRQAVADEIFKR
jgi:chemotaxis regulatin CheY-phosphate phosphatase CheZ